MKEFCRWFIPYAVSVSLALLAGRGLAVEPLSIQGPTRVEAHKLVILQAKGDVNGAALQWDVTPEDKADLNELPDGRLVIAAPPGDYRVRLRSLRLVDGKTVGETARWAFTVGGVPTAPQTPGKPTSQVPACIGELRVGNSGCTATAIWPRRSDGRWDVLTASHCTGGVGTKGVVMLKDGRSFSLTVTARSKQPDITWFVTDVSVDSIPYAVLASSDPLPGTPVWQAGYGQDRPTVRKAGTVIPSEVEGMAAFQLSVSHGDSGGPIFRADTDEIVGVVCCTSSIARTAKMYGGSATSAARLRPGSTAYPVDEGHGFMMAGCVHPLLLIREEGILPPLQQREGRWR